MTIARARSALRASTIFAHVTVAMAPSVAVAAASPQDDSLEAARLLHRLVEGERTPLALGKDVLGSKVLDVPIAHPPLVLSEPSSMDCMHAAHDITLDPITGSTTARLELRVKAAGNASLASVGFVLDEGLEVGAVTANDRETAVAEAMFRPARVVRVDLSPALSPGQETVITLPYSGTLSCAPPSSGAVACSKSATFSYFAHKSIFPYIFDPNAPGDVVFDGLTREIILRVPAVHEVVATGQKVSQFEQGATKVSTWAIDKPLSRTVGLYALVGELGLREVRGRSVPTTFVFPSPEKAIDRDLVSWSSPALDFVENVSGAKLPFERSLSLVRLPKSIGDPGTATFGMTLLSDSYESAGALMHEETWAHENTHLYWGVVVPETDANESRLMSEGMATLTQLDYSYARHFASEDRDEYLARRLLPMGLDLRAKGAALPPAQLLPGTSGPSGFRTSAYTLWAYYRTAIVLDHLRATIGDDVFADAVRAYGARCRFVGCRPDVLRDVASEMTGRDMQPFFDRWVTANERPRVRVGFAPVAGGADVELTKPDERPMTLELWLALGDGGRLKRRVALGPRATRVHIEASAPVLQVSVNPRHDVLVDAHSAMEGDLDFDGETDGFDILRCARLVGRTYETKGAAGLWRVLETFDPKCDVDGDLSIDDRDISLLAEQFGKLRPR